MHPTGSTGEGALYCHPLYLIPAAGVVTARL